MTVFQFFFIHLELRRELRDESGRKQGGKISVAGLKVVKMLMCSLEGGYTSKGLKRRIILLSFQRCVNPDKLFIKEVICLVFTTHYDLPIRN